MKRLTLIAALLSLTLMTYAIDSTYVEVQKHGVFQGYSGGMMFHAGYQFGKASGFQNNEGEEAMLRSITYGIGGALRVHLFSHWRIGAEGYVSTMPLKSHGDGSNIRTGWGGVLTDMYTKWGRFWPFIGVTLGGGAQRSTHVLTSDEYTIIGSGWKDTWENMKGHASLEKTYPAEFTKKGFFAADPFIGAEYAITTKLHLIVKADYLLCAHKRQFLAPSGPRLYVGFMFTH